jgi:hypothetical protein
MVDWGREDIMQHFLNGENWGLVIGRQGQVVGSMPWNIVSVTKNVTDFNLFYRGGGMTFPLYLYPTQAPTFGEPQTRTPNLNPDIIKEFERRLGIPFVPDDGGAASV